MSPHTKGKEQAAVTLRKTSGEKKKTATITTKKKFRERKGEENGRKNLIGWKKTARKKKERANESHDRCSELLGMRKPKERWTLALKALLVLTPLNCI